MLKRLNDVMAHLEQRLDQPVDVAELARIGRACQAVHGVSPGEARRTGATLRGQPRISFRLTIDGSGRIPERA